MEPPGDKPDDMEDPKVSKVQPVGGILDPEDEEELNDII